MRLRGTAVAIASLIAALAAAGCGFGPGDEVGQVSLTATRDYGAELVIPPVADEVSESDTVMRVLDRHADISTRFGGGFVSAIDGVSEAVVDGGRNDWFFYVDGVESAVGAADFPLQGGEAIWWDYREWSAVPRVPAVVGSFPRPLLGRYGGERRPVAIECRDGGDACRLARRRLSEAGVEPAAGSPDGAIRVLVGPWAKLREDPAAGQLERGPQASGVFAEPVRRRGGFLLRGLDEEGGPALELGGDAGLVAATRRYDEPPVWLVTGMSVDGVTAAAELLDAATLRNRYAVAVEGGRAIALPVR